MKLPPQIIRSNDMVDYFVGMVCFFIGLFLIYLRRRRPLYGKKSKRHDTFERLWYEIEDYLAGVGFLLLGGFIIYFELASLFLDKYD